MLLPDNWISKIQEKTKDISTFAFRLGGLVTYEKPVRVFPQDIPISNAFIMPQPIIGFGSILRSGYELPKYCCGFRIMSLVEGSPDTLVSINGGGNRRVYDGDVYMNSEINSLQFTAPTSLINPLIPDLGSGHFILQPFGLGD